MVASGRRELIVLVLSSDLFSWTKASVLHHLRAAEEAAVLRAAGRLHWSERSQVWASCLCSLLYLFTTSVLSLSSDAPPPSQEESHRFGRKHSTNAVFNQRCQICDFFLLSSLLWLSAVFWGASSSLAWLLARQPADGRLLHASWCPRDGRTQDGAKTRCLTGSVCSYFQRPKDSRIVRNN